METTKSFNIPKRLVWVAYKRVKANKGAAGVDNQSIEMFETDLGNNLFKIWNRMSSGSYFPPPVKRVEIPKGDGKTRPLGIPTISDRIAQMVVKIIIEPNFEKCFDADSYGYRPGKSALDAIGTARSRCWKYNWVVDIDIKGFFDNIDHQLLMRAVRKHITCKWVLLYIQRWLKAPSKVGKIIEERTKGTPQGGVISPLLANLFLHYALDTWVRKQFPTIEFERYADDAIYHCRTKIEAEKLKISLQERLTECNLEMNSEKSKIVYCKDGKRKGAYEHEKFDFLGYTFRPRLVRARAGNFFVGFTPAMSKEAQKKISDRIKSWKMQLWSNQSLESIAYILNPKIRGWINYYGKYQRSSTYKIANQMDYALVRWAKRKYKKLKISKTRARRWLARIREKQPFLFAHWGIATS